MSQWTEQTLLPLFQADKRNRRVTGRLKPLFTGYVFSRFAVNYVAKADITSGVLRVVRFGGMPAVVEDKLIDEIRAGLDDDGTLRRPNFDDLDLKRGDKVLVISGPMAGQEGMFDSRLSGTDRARILLATVEGSGWSSSKKPAQSSPGSPVRLQVGLESIRRIG